MIVEINARWLFVTLLLLIMFFVVSQQVVAIEAVQELQTQPSGTSEPRMEELKLGSEQWDQARHGERLLQVPVLKAVVNGWSEKKGQAIELRYPGGEEGELWVRELMDRLISLGIPSQYLIAVPGSGEADVIKFQIIKTGESYR